MPLLLLQLLNVVTPYNMQWVTRLTMRSKLVPVVNVASSYMQWILLGGIK
jgi:Zn-dependent membrane protease YugP